MIPENVYAMALQVLANEPGTPADKQAVELVARAIMAERARCVALATMQIDSATMLANQLPSHSEKRSRYHARARAAQHILDDIEAGTQP